MVVLALDDDEYDSELATELQSAIKQRCRVQILHVIRNTRRKSNDAVPICLIWDDMAVSAWKDGASWVIFLGDDIRIECKFHYWSIIRKNLGLPFGRFFGCPWFDDKTFPGFPTFPVIGKDHFDIFQSLIPKKHLELFINQDLDPYLQRLYLKFGVAPFMVGTNLTNTYGGADTKKVRYKRIPAASWRNKVLDDGDPFKSYVRIHAKNFDDPLILLDDVIPTFRMDIEYLQRLCSLEVLTNMRTTFIVIVDNPKILLIKVRCFSNDECERGSQFIGKAR